jgi:hypothetical protein
MMAEELRQKDLQLFLLLPPQLLLPLLQVQNLTREELNLIVELNHLILILDQDLQIEVMTGETMTEDVMMEVDVKL